MADAVTSTTILDGDKDFIVQLTNVSDSTGESAVTKVDVSGLTARKSDGAACTGVKLAKIFMRIPQNQDSYENAHPNPSRREAPSSSKSNLG